MVFLSENEKENVRLICEELTRLVEMPPSAIYEENRRVVEQINRYRTMFNAVDYRLMRIDIPEESANCSTLLFQAAARHTVRRNQANMNSAANA